MASETPADHATRAAEAIRVLNHATLSPGRNGWEYPGDAYDVIGGLDRMAGGLSQSLTQVWVLLARLAADRHLRSDRGDLDDDLATSAATLIAAHRVAQELQAALSRVHSATSPLAWQD